LRKGRPAGLEVCAGGIGTQIKHAIHYSFLRLLIEKRRQLINKGHSTVAISTLRERVNRETSRNHFRELTCHAASTSKNPTLN